MAKRKKRKKSRSSRVPPTNRAPKRERETQFPDPRLPTFRIEAMGGFPVEEDTFIYLVDRMRLPDGKVLAWHAPLMPAFYLLTAKSLLDAGEPERVEVMRTTAPSPREFEYADLDVTNDSLAMDAIGKVASAVILAAGAVEAYVNEAIDRLPDDATVETERRGEAVSIPRAEMVRRLSLEEKLDLVVPKVVGKESYKGRDPWPRFKRLNELRGEVVHVKARGRTDDPDIPSAVGRLLLGEGSTCVDDAVAVIRAYEPTWLPEATRAALGIPD